MSSTDQETPSVETEPEVAVPANPETDTESPPTAGGAQGAVPEHDNIPEGQRDLLAILATPGIVEWAQWATNAGLDLTKLRNDMRSARMVAEAARQDAANEFALERERLQNQADQAKAEVAARDKVHSAEVAERDKLHSAELEKSRLEAKLRYQNDRVRSIVLLAVVLALVLMPVFAMLSPSPRISPEEFTQYIAPIVGIAGTVLGYWFGKQEKTG